MTVDVEEGNVLEVDSLHFLILTGVVGALVIFLFYIKNAVAEASKERESNTKSGNQHFDGEIKDKKQSLVKKKTKEKPAHFRKEQKHTFSHPWLASSLKGHSQDVLHFDFSINGKYVASCSADRSVLIWSVKDFDQKDHKSVRANVELDHATHVRFSPDSKAFITSLANKNTVRIFKIGRKEDGSLGNIAAMEEDFPARHHDHPIAGLGISCTGRFILTASPTSLLVWGLRGDLLATVDTRQVATNYATVSPCGRFVASAGFTPDVKVWEVCFTKSGDFKDVVRAFELKGHSAGVLCFAFNLDSTRMASVSKDGTWRLWDTNVEYTKGQEPYLLVTTKVDGVDLVSDQADRCLIALAPDALTVVVSVGADLRVYNTSDGGLVELIEDVHSSPISCLAFAPSSAYFLSAGDRHMRVFHNVQGFRAKIQDLKQRLPKASNNTHRDRIQEDIKDARNRLAAILGN